MVTNSVYGTNQTYTVNTQSTSKSGDAMGKDDFLKLLVLQLQNQDPLEPMKNEEYLAQLAQFNSLEQMQNLNKTMSAMSNVQTLSNTAGLIGKQVEFLQDGSTVDGPVTAVKFTDGTAYLVVNALGKDISITTDSVLSVH